jgi:hypothetical protein
LLNTAGVDGSRFQVEGGARFTLGVNMATTSGSVGIGTASPQSRLEISEANRANSTNIANVGIYTSSTQNTDVGGTIAFGGFFSGSALAPFASIRGGKENSTSGNYAGYLAFQTIPNNGSLTERARITSAGRLLLGTTSESTFILDVNGTARVSGAVTGGLYNGVLVSSRTATQSVFIGVDAGSSATASMAHNVIMGHSAAYSMTTGNWNTIIGRQAATLSATINNSILIGANNLNQYTGTITDVLSFGVASTNVSFVSYPIFGTGIKDASPSFRIGGNNDLALSALPSVTASAILDLTSTTKGFLPPRMTTTQKNAIGTPAQGLMVFDTTLVKLCVYSGTAWETITSI